EEVTRHARHVTQRALEQLGQYEDRDSGGQHLAPGLGNRGPALAPEPANSRECEETDRQRYADDHDDRERTPMQRHARLDEKARRDELRAEDDTIEADLADQESDEGRNDDDVERR